MGKYGESGLQSSRSAGGKFAGADQAEVDKPDTGGVMQDHVFMLVIRSEEREGKRVLHTLGKILGAGGPTLDTDGQALSRHIKGVKASYVGPAEAFLLDVADKPLPPRIIVPSLALRKGN